MNTTVCIDNLGLANAISSTVVDVLDQVINIPYKV